MIAKEFLSELEQIRASFEWHLVPDQSHLDVERRSRPRLRIRGFCKYGPEDVAFEPIGAVCYIRTAKIFNEDAWIDAANAIELSLIDAGDLIAAANDRVWADSAEGRNPSEYLQRLRRRLADAVALKLDK
jgi:hypothetical protein